MPTLLVFLILGYVLPSYADEQALRYRGEYTYGHEVNTFCPKINSQCYWLNPTTSEEIRLQLRQSYPKTIRTNPINLSAWFYKAILIEKPKAMGLLLITMA